MSVHDRGQRSKTILLLAVITVACHVFAAAIAMLSWNVLLNITNMQRAHAHISAQIKQTVRSKTTESGIAPSPSLNGEYTVQSLQ